MQGSAVGSEILPRINETGVFRLEFPAAELSVPSETKRSKEECSAATPSSDSPEQHQSRVGSSLVGKEMSESLRNIVLIQESMMELRQGSSPGDVKCAREIGVVVPPGAACLSEVFSGSSKPCIRSKSAELIVKSPPENRLSPIFGNVPILKIPGMVERESFDPSKLQSSHVRSMRSPVRSPLGLEVKSPSPTAHVGIGSCAMPNKPSPAKSPVATEVKSLNPAAHTPAGLCGVSTVQRAPRPARSPVSADVNTTGHCTSGSPMRNTDTKVGKPQQERGLWRPIDICTSRQLTEAALQKIAANKSISIGQVKDRRPQVLCRNRQGVAPDGAQVPQSLSSSLGNRQQADFLVKEALPSPHCLDANVVDKFHGCSTLLIRAHPELSVTSRSEFKSGIHIPSSPSTYVSTLHKSSLSPPPCKAKTLPVEERLSPRLSAESEQPRVSPRPSDRVSGRVSAKDGRHVAEAVCSLKEKALLKVTALLKKVTNKLSSGQLSRALAVEALVQRFLQRCRRDHCGTSATALTSGEDVVTSSVWGTSCTVSALCERNVEDCLTTPAETTSSALQAYREPGTARNIENILSALSLFLSGQLDSFTSHAPQVVSHFGGGGSVVVPSIRRRSWSDTPHPSRNAILSVKQELVAQPKPLTRLELLAKRELLVKPKAPLSRRLLQKRGVLATGVSEVSPVQKRRRLAGGAPMPGVVADVHSATTQRQRFVNACLPRKEVGEVVPKDCVVVLHRLELRNVEETMLKKRRGSGGARPKKKPKLSPLPKAPSCVKR
ncbi:hypothetical protein HPB52_018890 [Rhipicephalus sanguineus]|uniref:Uncharacterized protein n=1 Tax=Rhipicephalus sanguineus TaxID=34632 RepID=A0A9D4QBP5_RHISA|nr:hypothetical protein HPB52_018890 [Rhipicephalus sanguineus]